MRGISFPRHNRIAIPTIVAGAGEKAFVMTVDIDDNRVPKRIKIVGIAVKPAAATIRSVRLYSKASRISDASDVDYSLIYEDQWSSFTEATNEHSFINPDKIYIDDDADDEFHGTIYGTIEIKAAATNSVFKIDIDYFDM